MKLREKTLLAFASLFLLGLATISIFSDMILMKSFESLENDTVRQEAKRGYNAIYREADFLSTLASDWALWDDTYNFVHDRNEEYVSSNLVDSSYYDVGLDAIIIVNISGEIVYHGSYDHEEEEQVPAPDSLLGHLQHGGLLLQHTDSEDSSVEGVLMLPEGPMIVASRPILTSDGEGPVRGALIMGRYLTEDKLGEIAKSGELSLRMIKYSGGEMDEGFVEAKASLKSDKDIHVQEVNEDRIAAYTLISDISGEPTLILKADIRRGISATGKATIQYFLFFLLMLGLMSAIIIWVLLNRFVLSKVSRLNRRINEIIKSGDHSARVVVKGGDEVSSLAEFINNMLASLEKSGEEFNRETLRSIGSRIAVLNREGVIVFTNEPWTEPVFQEKVFGQKMLSVGDGIDTVIDGFKGDMTEEEVSELKRVIEGEMPESSMEVSVPGSSAPLFYQIEATSFSGRGGGAVLALSDITGRKTAEQRLLESLGEKELLLKEIHHRVKNNLQVISSILHMKEESTSNPEIAEVLRANRNRIYSMALVHEKLYESESISRINIREYVESLVRHIHETYNTGNIIIKTDSDSIVLSIDQLIPCGIILNELITNAVKYAFSDMEQGIITIRVALNDDDSVELSVRDNGPGLPEIPDFENTESLGFILLSSLAEQLGGTLHYQYDKGALFVVRFTKEQMSGG